MFFMITFLWGNIFNDPSLIYIRFIHVINIFDTVDTEIPNRMAMSLLNRPSLSFIIVNKKSSSTDSLWVLEGGAPSSSSLTSKISSSSESKYSGPLTYVCERLLSQYTICDLSHPGTITFNTSLKLS